MVDKYSIITIVAIIVIIIPFAYSGLNIVSANNLSFEWMDENNFKFFEMSNNKDIIICNPLPVPVTFNQIQMRVFFEKNQHGALTIPGQTLEPGKNTAQSIFTSDNFAGNQYLLMEFDAQLTGTSEVRHDLRQLVIVVNVDTPILGMIPYSTSYQFQGESFMEMMNQKTEC